MKADAKTFKGIEYVQISELPQTQGEILIRTINPDLFIKLLIDGKIISGCLQYKDYCNWYQEYCIPGQLTAREQPAVPSLEIEPGLALDKA